ncbi:PREDICTED: protein HHL1, chloroplastic [Lupinus angustifolius]|uniref:protein HHL1, chloroplastic n=1 Tax=Lupinus angustifolius TaxID=3871 RepID=UPI00092E2BF8|nr:PREDICTED: protein HHL1, chloroplastic [Lupinus angustifolius]
MFLPSFQTITMEVGMSLNALVHLPPSTSRLHLNDDASLLKHSLFSTKFNNHHHHGNRRRTHSVLVVEAKGKKGMISRQFQRPPPPPLPKIEDDGNPKFVIFMRMANVYLWYPLSVVTGGTTAKIMVAAKDNFLGKYIYKDTLDRNLAAVIYQDEKAIQKTAFKQYRVLRSATNYRYGYKIVENGNIRSALSTTDVIELPTEDKLKTVLDKVKDFFGDAKESFGKITALGSTATDDEPEKDTEEKSKVKG